MSRLQSATAKSQGSKASAVPSHLSRMSEARRTKLEEIQKREQLKGMLITKFKSKYGQNDSNLQHYIDNEVLKFLNSNRLTETNLKGLDEKIQLEKYTRDKKAAILEAKRNNEDVQSVVSEAKQNRPMTAAVEKQQFDDMKSQASRMSRASRPRSNYGLNKTMPKKADEESVITQSVKEKPENSDSDLEEEDEWSAIQKFNAVLHFEEQKQAAAREAARRTLMKKELDQQAQVKIQKKLKLQEEDRQYDEAQKAHLKLLEEREKEKQRLLQDKILQDKISRDAQLRKMEHKRRKDARENLEQEVHQVQRLKEEMERERIVQLEKKKQEREYFMKMLEENKLNLEKAKVQKEKEKQEDIRAQKEYARMLDQQAQDRLNEIQAREKRAQDFMNRMADGVLKELDNIQKKEDDMIQKYEKQREMKMRQNEEKKARKAKKDREEMTAMLAEQAARKKQAEIAWKEDTNGQAAMWAKERDIWQEEDKRIQNKIKLINQETQNFLKQQELEKKNKNKKMDPTEKELNKGLMREIKGKQRKLKEQQSQAAAAEAESINDRY